MSQARSVTRRTVSRSSPARSLAGRLPGPHRHPARHRRPRTRHIGQLPTGGIGLFRSSLAHRAEPAEMSSAPVPGASNRQAVITRQAGGDYQPGQFG